MARDYDHLKPYHFKPGSSGNPSGRPKGKHYIADAYRKILGMKLPKGKDLPKAFKQLVQKFVEEGATVAEFVALGQIRAAIAGKTIAASEVTDRVEGKAKQQHQITGGGGPLENVQYDVEKLTPDQLRKMIELMLEAGPPEDLDDDSGTRSDDHPAPD